MSIINGIQPVYAVKAMLDKLGDDTPIACIWVTQEDCERLNSYGYQDINGDVVAEDVGTMMDAMAIGLATHLDEDLDPIDLNTMLRVPCQGASQ